MKLTIKKTGERVLELGDGPECFVCGTNKSPDWYLSLFQKRLFCYRCAIGAPSVLVGDDEKTKIDEVKKV